MIINFGNTCICIYISTYMAIKLTVNLNLTKKNKKNKKTHVQIGNVKSVVNLTHIKLSI